MFRASDGVPKVRQNRLCRPFRARVLPHTRSRGFAPACGLLAPFGASSTPSGQKRPKGTINNREKCSLGYRNRRTIPQATSTERKSQRDDRPQAGGERSETPAMFRASNRVPKVRQDLLCRPFWAWFSLATKQGFRPCLWSFSPFRGSSGAHKSKGLSNHGSNITPSLRYSPNV